MNGAEIVALVLSIVAISLLLIFVYFRYPIFHNTLYDMRHRGKFAPEPEDSFYASIPTQYSVEEISSNITGSQEDEMFKRTPKPKKNKEFPHPYLTNERY